MPATDTDILNPGTSLEVFALKNGDWIMAYNDLEEKRYSLLAMISDDEGRTWKWRRHLAGDPSVKVTNEYHYPSVMHAKDGTIHFTYSYFVAEGKSIKHAQFSEDWVKAGDPAK